MPVVHLPQSGGSGCKTRGPLLDRISRGWFARTAYARGLAMLMNQGPVVLMIENYRSELLWRLTRKSPYVVSR